MSNDADITLINIYNTEMIVFDKVRWYRSTHSVSLTLIHRIVPQHVTNPVMIRQYKAIQCINDEPSWLKA
jgi:hypothetical protein